MRLRRLKAATALPSSSTAIARRTCFFRSAISSSSSSSSCLSGGRWNATTLCFGGGSVFSRGGFAAGLGFGFLGGCGAFARWLLETSGELRRSYLMPTTERPVNGFSDFGKTRNWRLRPGLKTNFSAVRFGADCFLKNGHHPLRFHGRLKRPVLRRVHQKQIRLGLAALLDDVWKSARFSLTDHRTAAELRPSTNAFR